jgi:hypothetical protein
MEPVSEPDPSETSRTKVRVGLAMVGIVLVLAMVLGYLAEEPLVKALMFGVSLLAVVRAVLLSRALRAR